MSNDNLKPGVSTAGDNHLLVPAALFDMDGTIRYSANGEFINRAEDVRLFDDVEDKLRGLLEHPQGPHLIGAVSNQGGVAFGYMTVEEANAIEGRTLELFEDHPFTTVRACFHHPQGTVEPYCHGSLQRKPNTGMLSDIERTAYQEGFVIDWPNSFMVGDRDEDKECASNAGISFYWADEYFGR